jgi:hypothetical protein
MASFKFQLGQEVKVAKGEVKGVVIQQRYILNHSKDLTRETREYYVELSPQKKLWYMENVLESLTKDVDEVDALLEHSLKKTEKFLKEHQIDHMLKHRDFDGLKDLT